MLKNSARNLLSKLHRNCLRSNLESAFHFKTNPVESCAGLSGGKPRSGLLSLASSRAWSPPSLLDALIALLRGEANLFCSVMCG
jgi:hypothetical protein